MAFRNVCNLHCSHCLTKQQCQVNEESIEAEKTTSAKIFSQHALGGWIFGMSVDVDECVYRCYEHFGWWKKTLCLNSNEASITIRTVNVILLQYNSQQTLLLQCKYFLNLFISTKPMESYSCLRTISYRFLVYSCMMAMIQNSVHSILMEL